MLRGSERQSFLSDVGHEIPTALLPSLLTSTLGAPASVLGLIEGFSDGLAGLAKLGGGALADDPTRRRRIAIGGYATTAVLAAGTGAATATWHVGLLRAGAWTARGLRVPARNALLADIVSPAAYGRAYGFERAMDNLGAIGGPLRAIGLINMFSIRTAIAISVIPGLFAAVAILYAIRHTPTRKRTEAAPNPASNSRCPDTAFRTGFAGITAFELGNCAATQSVGNLAASGIAGIIWTTTSPSWAFAYLTAWMITATVLLAITRQPTRRLEPAS